VQERGFAARHDSARRRPEQRLRVTAAAVIGAVTEGGLVRVLDGTVVLGEMPVTALVDDCPVYELDPQQPTEPLYPPPRRTIGVTPR